MPYHFKLLTAAALVPVMRLTGFRFSKHYRHGTTTWHRLAYACVQTVAANHAAGIAGVRIPVFVHW